MAEFSSSAGWKQRVLRRHRESTSSFDELWSLWAQRFPVLLTICLGIGVSLGWLWNSGGERLSIDQGFDGAAFGFDYLLEVLAERIQSLLADEFLELLF